MNFYADALTTFVCGVMFVQLLTNLLFVPRLGHLRQPQTDKQDGCGISVLVPARNEESTIADCIDSILKQNLHHFEILVLDDNSTDQTSAIVSKFTDPRIRLIRGKPLPENWTGKNWSCHQLSQHATYEVFMFVDADTTLQPTATSEMLTVLRTSNAGLVSALPAARYETSSDIALLPIINVGLLALFPIWLMHSRFLAKASVAMGPCLMVTKDAYLATGGHAKAPTEVVDDVMLSRRIKSSGYPVRLCNGTDLVSTRWYGTLRGTWHGFTKNAFGALLLPCLRLVWGAWSGDITGLLLLQVALLLGTRVVAAVAGKDPIRAIVVHPFAVIFWGLALFWSAVLTLSHRTVQWRDRDVQLSPQ
jgi:cellulose synthase/poly-beta-1,6-N-acetylglucosamine synthase-like glycosyltransferase